MRMIVVTIRYCLLACLLMLATTKPLMAMQDTKPAVDPHPLLKQASALRFENPEAAVALLQDELDQAHAPELRLEMADMATRIARDHGWLEQAMNYSNRMIMLAEQLEKPALKGRALHMQGTIMAEKGEISAAIENFHDARRILETTSETESLALTVNALGVAHSFLGNSDRSREYYQQALPLAREAGNQDLQLSIKSNLALITADLEGPVASIELHETALQLAREQQHLPHTGNQLANLCKQYVLINQLEAAEAACDEALSIAESLNHARLLAGTLMTTGDLRAAQNQPEAALDFYQRALPHVENSLPFVEVELLDKMIDLHEQRGNFELAVRKLRRYQQLHNEIIDSERNETIQRLEVQYRVEEQAREMELLQLNNQLQTAELHQRESILYATTFALILVLLIVLITWRGYRTKAQLQHDLAIRNAELKQAIGKVSDLANRDVLTGLFNRRAFHQIAELENSRNKANQKPLTIVIADIDHFKLVNDEFGHPVGDQMLKEIAQRLNENLRGADMICRWGGEEFLMLMPETSAQTANAVVQRIRKSLAMQPVQIDSKEFPVTLTFGIAEVQSTIKDAIQAADGAMYAGKRAGSDRAVISNLIELVAGHSG